MGKPKQTKKNQSSVDNSVDFINEQLNQLNSTNSISSSQPAPSIVIEKPNTRKRVTTSSTPLQLEATETASTEASASKKPRTTDSALTNQKNQLTSKREVKQVSEMWWKGIVGVPVVKKEISSPQTPKRRAPTAAPVAIHPVAPNLVVQELVQLSGRVAALEVQLKIQGEQFQQTIRDLVNQIMINSIELIKAFNSK